MNSHLYFEKFFNSGSILIAAESMKKAKNLPIPQTECRNFVIFLLSCDEFIFRQLPNLDIDQRIEHKFCLIHVQPKPFQAVTYTMFP
jgi:hypothetical protein